MTDTDSRIGLSRQVVRYGIIGIGNTVLGYSLILGAHAAGLSVVLANVLGYAIGLTLSYFANRAWTFDGPSFSGREIPAYAAVVGTAFALNLLTLGALARGGVPFPAAQAVGMAAYSVFMFLGLRHVVFAARS